jgi:hypothetical protein
MRRSFSAVRVIVVTLTLVAVAFVGCATKRDLVSAKMKGRGTQRSYPVTVDQAWIISRTILELEPTEKVEEHRAEGYMVTSDEISALTPSTYMGVFIEPDGARETKVTFVTRRRTPTQAYAALSEGSFHRKFAELLKLVAAIGPLPSDAPADAGVSTDASPSDVAPTPADAGVEGGS